jgi:hypothetical protein
MSVPPVDPCAEAARLRGIRDQIITGGQVVRTRFDTEEVEFGKADLTRLETLIAQYDAACALQSGTPQPRRRYAKSMSFRPY